MEPLKVKCDNNLIGYNISFKKKLENMLSIPLAINPLTKNTITEQNGEYIKKTMNELNAKSMRLNNENEIISVVLYYDDIEVVNPIGNSRKKHKLGKKFNCLNISNTWLYCFSFFLRNVLLDSFEYI